MENDTTRFKIAFKYASIVTLIITAAWVFFMWFYKGEYIGHGAAAFFFVVFFVVQFLITYFSNSSWGK